MKVSESKNKEEKTMWTIQEMKERGKAAFQGNYWPSVLAALLMSLFAGASTVSRRSGETSPEELQQAVQAGDKTFIVVFLSAFAVIAVIGLLIKIFLANPIELGGVTFFTENIETGPVPFSTIKRGFQNYGHNFVVLFLRDLYLILWLMLFVVPGLVKMYSYRMVPYILAEHPELSANEVITRSREMMNGNKWQSFKLDLSFIGWILLSCLTLGIVHIFWTGPYMESTQAALYLKLRDQM